MPESIPSGQSAFALDVGNPVAAVAHDAGAANHLVAWLAAADPGLRISAYMAGPARAIWDRMMPGVALAPAIPAALDGAATVISGTGWASDIEHVARLLAATSGIRSIAVIDHWVNYEGRFVRNGVVQLPDEIWVSDEYALGIASSVFPATPIRQLPNLYLASQLAGLASPPASGGDMLYVLEPMRDDWGRGSPGEFQALDYFLARIDALDVPRGIRIRLRLHPSEELGKYDAWLAANPALVLDDSSDLRAALVRASWVVGCETYALVVALAAGRTVYSSLPPWAPPRRLPHDGIIEIRRAG